MDGQSLQPLKRLGAVYLHRNVCIDEDFLDATAIATMPETVTNKCGLSKDSGNFLNLECGKVSFSVGLAIGGRETERGQWPFLVALFNFEENQFFCGGNLISSKNVLTGKSCSGLKGKEIYF